MSAPAGPPLPAPPVVASGLAVHLVWRGDADLDLVVTDPAGETYAADRPGTVMSGDVGCPAAASGGGVETATWDAPATGRYRVGVAYPEACDEAGAVEYRILVDVDGRRRATDGIAVPLQRTPNAVEVVFP